MRAPLAGLLISLATAAWAEAPKAQLTKEGAALFKQAEAAKKAKNFEKALVHLDQCVKGSPGHYPCYRLLGTVHAMLAVRDHSDDERAKARAAYETYLELAPPTDEYVLKVKAILEER